MAQILTNFTRKLVVAICSDVLEISARCFVRELINSEEYEYILKSTTTSTEHAARTLLTAVKDAVAIDQVRFKTMMKILKNTVTPVPPFMQEMEEQYQDLTLCAHSSAESHKRKRTDSDPTEMDKEQAATLKVRKLTAGNEPDTISRVRIIEMFASRIVCEISSHIATLCDKCYSFGLIGDKTYRRLHETIVDGKKDKARTLLIEVMKSIQNDDQCFGIFLKALNMTLPTAIGSKLVRDIKKKSEKYTLVPSANADVYARYRESIQKLDEANREKEKLKKRLDSKIRDNNMLRENLFREENREKENTEKIKQLKKEIDICDHEILYLRETIKFKEMEVENCYKKMRIQRELYQEERRLTGDLYCGEELHRDANKLEVKMLEKLEIYNQDLEQNVKTQSLEQELEKTGFVEGSMKLMQEKNDLQEKTEENCSLQSKINFVKSEHGDCIIRFWSRPCYCYRGDIPREYCPAKRHII